MKFVATIGDRVETVEITGREGRYQVALDGRRLDIDARLTPQGIYSLLIGGASYVVDVRERDGTTLVDVGGERYAVRVEEATRYTIRTHGGAAGGHGAQTVRAPLPGRVTHVAVQAGDTVQAGDPLLVIEAMKMENEFRASLAGTVSEVRVQAGQAVNGGDVLMVITA
ncbi:MAG: acetyl-CoA carboxylase biotin carboxyl carrier protein subunit [Candidatus Rokuibacteriota bacterium]